jgi:hypothetical protein
MLTIADHRKQPRWFPDDTRQNAPNAASISRQRLLPNARHFTDELLPARQAGENPDNLYRWTAARSRKRGRASDLRRGGRLIHASKKNEPRAR